ncbi:Neuronal acetylcholine receptor subunit alpha-6 [Mizuhopecten yessoensis]|uniref:Neuronal acetylcholine receptor subunit alpha-6 n=1 Tax=Mizuhopecten yessoensis TaxID=6573 RepID=A0A210PZ80_MIZYE|nr:Neuronal acetylcholine receptor subunit alpha-6 [Mizuhopecten yessoensis]
MDTMKSRLSVLLLLILAHHIFRSTASIIHQTSGNATAKDLEQLQANLLSKYSKDNLPVFNLSDTVFVQMRMYILSINDLDEVSGTVTLSAGFNLLWHDYRLEWTPSDYEGLATVRFKSSNSVWTPGIVMITSAENLKPIPTSDFPALVTSSGDVSVSSGQLLKSSCNLEMTKFPMDFHTCSLVMTPWGYYMRDMQLQALSSTFDLNFFTPNGEWDLVSTDVSNYTEYGDAFSMLAFTMVLSRRSAYYTISLIIPLWLLCCVGPFTFLVPTGDRLGFMMNVYLSLAVYMTLVSDNLPKISLSMPGLSYFLLMAICYSVGLVFAVIFINRYEDIDDVNEFPSWLRKLLRWTKKKKNNAVGSKKDTSDNRVAALDPDQENSEYRFPEEVSKSDVLNFIDKSMFTGSTLVLLGMSAWYYFAFQY